MKKLTLLLACILCVSILCTACQIGDENPSVHLGSGTTPDTGSTDPSTPEAEITDPSTPETEVTEPSVPETESTEPSTPETEPPAPTDPDTGLPVYVPGSLELMDHDIEQAPPNRKYRYTYYNMWGEFMYLVLDDHPAEFYRLMNEISASTDYGKNQEEMLLVSLIKHFNIPREEFDKALEKYIANHTPEELKTEYYEPPNGDIIYTFDNEIINHYYRYE